MAAQKRSKGELRLVRSATAYRRLAWKQGTSEQQRARYNAKADRLMRQADEIRDRRARAQAAGRPF